MESASSEGAEQSVGLRDAHLARLEMQFRHDAHMLLISKSANILAKERCDTLSVTAARTAKRDAARA
jgi:hypothetical protein